MRASRLSVPRRLTSVAAVVLLGACADSNGPAAPGEPVDPVLFRSYVALGNSITAGYQSGGINDSTQRESYARLVAQQMGTSYRYPSVGAAGCTPPFAGPLDVVTSPFIRLTCSLPGGTASGPLNNVAVPGADSFDPVSPAMSGADRLARYILGGGGTQVGRARETDPSFVSVWIGNNDVLGEVTQGILRAPDQAGTPLAQFAANYAQMMGALASPNLRGGVLIGVVDASLAPLLIPASALAQPAVRAGIERYAGRPVIVRADCAGSSSLISLGVAISLRVNPTRDATIGCAKAAGQVGGPGDEFVLDADEVAAVRRTVTAYNAYIRAKADSLGFAYYDPNPTLLAFRADGRVPAVPDFLAARRPFGAYVSADGVHPAGAAHRVIADEIIAAINATYHVAIPRLTGVTP